MSQIRRIEQDCDIKPSIPVSDGFSSDPPLRTETDIVGRDEVTVEGSGHVLEGRVATSCSAISDASAADPPRPVRLPSLGSPHSLLVRAGVRLTPAMPPPSLRPPKPLA